MAIFPAQNPVLRRKKGIRTIRREDREVGLALSIRRLRADEPVRQPLTLM